jgi:hypothetical protein
LWDSNAELFTVYGILRSYLNENYGLDSAVLLAIIKEKELPVIQTLTDIPYIHSGYLNVVLPKADSNGESKDIDSGL